MDLSQYKYKSEFASHINIVAPTDENQNLAIASLQDLKQYFPADTNIDDNPDLLYIAFAGYNGGIANRNGDGVSKATAIEIAKYFKNKYIDKEHDRTKIVGNLLGFGFTKHGSNESITEEEAKACEEPIDVILSGYVWKTVDEKLADDIIEASDEKSLKYGDVSASWELYYNEYDIAVGSRNLSQAKIISEPGEVENYSKFLRSNGGRGVNDQGEEVYKMIKGECLPIGLGLVGSPAGIVKGVSVFEEKPIVIKAEELENLEGSIKEASIEDLSYLLDEKRVQLAAANLKLEEVAKEFENFKQNINNLAEKNKKSVNDNVDKTIGKNLDKQKTKNMKKFKDYTQETFEALAASDAYRLALELDNKMTEYANELDSKANEVKAEQDKFEAYKKEQELVTAELEKVKAELKQINEVRAAEKIQNDFNVRMADLNEKFELDADKSKSIAKQIKGLDDESFAAWLEDIKTFLVAKEFVPFGKKKGEDEEEDSEDDKKEDKKEMKKSECKASLDFLDEIKNLKADTKPVLNKETGKEQTYDEQFAEAFGDILEN